MSLCVQALVFDFGSEVYLWQGQDVSLSRRNVALQLTHQVWVGAYDYSNCRVNPLDPTQCNPDTQRYVHTAGGEAFSPHFTTKNNSISILEQVTETVEYSCKYSLHILNIAVHTIIAIYVIGH